MKKRLVALLMAAAMVSGMVGCGSSTETSTAAQEEAAAEPEETAEPVEAAEEAAEEPEEAIEETAEAEETAEEEEVVEPMTFERNNYVLVSAVTNITTPEDYPTSGVLFGDDENTFNTNDYIDAEIMTELYNRGYDIDGFTVSWMVALNEDGEKEYQIGTVPYKKVNDSGERYVKIHPLFIKDSNIDESRLVWNYYKESPWVMYDNPDDAPWDAVHEAVAAMKEDPNYEEIDFHIPETQGNKDFEEAARIRQADYDKITYKDFTINDLYNGMIYAMFVSKTVDLDGFYTHTTN